MTTSATHDDTASSVAAPRRQRADARRNSDRLLGAARAVFAEHGPDASLEEIARRAEVGIGTLYRHYPTRQALLEAVFHDDVESARARADELLQSDAPLDALTTWLHDQLEQAGSCRGLAASVMITMLDERARSPVAVRSDARERSRVARRAQQAGTVRADTNIDDLLRLVSAVALATEDAPDGSAQAERMFALLMNGVRGAPTTRPGGRNMAVETTVGASGTERDVANATIDSDGHVQEQLTLPPDIMTEVMERIGGTDMEALMASMAAPENDPFPMESSGPPTLQTIAGGWDPLARLVDMDADGIDMAVLYPTTPGLSFVPDAERWGWCAPRTTTGSRSTAPPRRRGSSAWASCRCRIRRRPSRRWRRAWSAGSRR